MTEYYVDYDNGSDSNDGLSSGSGAWKTMSKVMTEFGASTFSGGDNINLAGGVTWPYTDTTSFYVTDSGTDADNKITIKGPSSANKAILNMQIGLWSNEDYIRFENLSLIDTDLTGGPANYAIDMASVTGRVYGYDFVNIDITGFGNGMNCVYVDGLLIDNINQTGSTGSGINVSGSGTTSSTMAQNGTIKNCTINIEGASNDCISLHEGAGIGINLVGPNWDIYDNDVRGADENGFDITAGSNVHVVNNYATNNSEVELHNDHSATNVHYVGNYVDVERDGITALINGLHVYNNYFVGQSGHRYLVTIDNANTSETDVSFEFENNTFVSNNPSGTGLIRWERNGSVGGYDNDFLKCHFRNNIYTTVDETMPHIYVFSLLTGGELDWDDAAFTSEYNILHDPAGTPTSIDASGSSISWATWSATYTNDLQGNPGLVDRTLSTVEDKTDLEIADTDSLAYSNGLAITTGTYYYWNDGTSEIDSTTGLDYDSEGNARGTDIGAAAYTDTGDPPTVSVQSASNRTTTSFTANGNITNIGDSTVIERGFQYNTSESASGASIVKEDESTYSTGAYSLSVSGLSEKTTYYYRSFAVNAGGTGYSSWQSVTTLETHAEVVIGDGEEFLLHDGDDLSQVNFSGDGVGGTLRTVEDDAVAEVYNINMDNLTIGHEGFTGEIMYNSLVDSECTGTYLGAAEDYEPGACQQEQPIIDNNVINSQDIINDDDVINDDDKIND